MNYREYRAQRQYEFNSLPIFFAFSNEQFDNGMKKLGIEDIKDVRAIGGGGFCHKDTIPKLVEFTNSDSIDELMKDPEFAEDAIYYEMGNHEYHINTYQGNWDVCSCFGNVEYNEWDDPTEYFKQLGWEQQTIDAFYRARDRFFKAADDNGWY